MWRTAMIWIVIWTVLMMFWLFFGCWTSWNPSQPQALGGTLIPWLCVLILGLVLFGGIAAR